MCGYQEYNDTFDFPTTREHKSDLLTVKWFVAWYNPTPLQGPKNLEIDDLFFEDVIDSNGNQVIFEISTDFHSFYSTLIRALYTKTEYIKQVSLDDYYESIAEDLCYDRYDM